MPRNPRQILIEDARIIFRNFSGAKGKFNAEGERSFHVVLDPDVAEQLKSDGWNVKVRDPREDGDEPMYHLKVNVSYKGRPPQIITLGESNREVITERDVDLLDSLEIVKVDLTINPYDWESATGSGTSAYLERMYATIEEDYLDRKYALPRRLEED